MVYDNNYKTAQPAKQTEYRRLRTEESISEFKNDLMTQNWDIILKGTVCSFLM